MDKTYRRATAVATTVLVFGVAASLAGNIQAIHLDNGKPGVGAIVSALVWPLVLFGVVELLLHTPWVANWRDRLTKLATVLAVGSVAAWVSYWHLANVLSHYGYDVASRYAGPVVVDMAMILAALALNRIGQARRGQVARQAALDINNGQAVMTFSQDISQEELDKFWAALSKHAVSTSPKDTDTDMDMQTAYIEDLAEDTARWQTLLADQMADDDAKSVATEAESYLRGLDNPTPAPAAPVPVVPGPAPVRRSRTEIDAGEALEIAREARGKGQGAGEIAVLLAGWYGVSTRTIRRQPWWTAAMGRDASEGADAS